MTNPDTPPPVISRRRALFTGAGLLASSWLAGRAAAPDAARSLGIEVDPERKRPSPVDAAERVLRAWTDRRQHLRLTAVELQDRTDHYNELVHEREWLLHPSETLALTGNLFVIEETGSGAGLVVLKLMPLPHARPVADPVDLRVQPREDTGFDFYLVGAAAVAREEGRDFVLLPYTGGEWGRTLALQEFQRARRAHQGDAAWPRLLSNTWGDRSRDARISHAFIAQEIEAGARLGIEVVQIDDGWQTGISSNSVRSQGKGVWSGFWANRADFWRPDPVKFPHGLAPLSALARQRGLSLGLWFAPDSSDDFANWERDAECVLGLHREFAVDHFKIDGVHAPTAAALANLHRLFRTLIDESHGRLVFDLDVTAALRPGYFGLIEPGPLFVENRYTDRHKYWPHQTLRNLWKLSRWVDPGRLRMEFLNTSRNQAEYPDDPLAPATYPWDTLFATVFCSNPLAWCEVSNLPPAAFDVLPGLIARWKQLRPAFFSGTILPLGAAPDGYHWTGFLSVAPARDRAIALIFRQLAPAAEGRLALPGPDWSASRCTRLEGQGGAEVIGRELHLRGIDPQGFSLLELSR